MGSKMTNETGTLLLWGYRGFPREDLEQLHYHKVAQDTDGKSIMCCLFKKNPEMSPNEIQECHIKAIYPTHLTLLLGFNRYTFFSILYQNSFLGTFCKNTVLGVLL